MSLVDYKTKPMPLSAAANRLIADLSDNVVEELKRLRDLCHRFPPYSGHTKAQVRAALEPVGLSAATFYRRRKQYVKLGTLTSLLPPRGRHKASKRLHSDVENILRSEIQRMQRNDINSATEIHRAIVGAIYGENLKRTSKNRLNEPSVGTVYNRLMEQSKQEAATNFAGGMRADKLVRPYIGKTPVQLLPHARYQIDHTLVDRWVVSEDTGDALRRPWITLAIDEATRAIVGMMLSFEAPSATNLARFMTHMVFPKDEYLEDLDVDFDWPMYGKPASVYTDNGSDFRSKAFKLGNAEHNIHHERRPVGEAHFGGHIESVIGTAMKQAHLMPGRTQKKWLKEIKRKPPADVAVSTMRNLEKEMVTWITSQYHTDSRKELGGRCPQQAWESYFKPGCDLPAPPPILPSDRIGFYRDYLPSRRRSLEKGVIRAHSLEFWSEILEPFVRRRSKKGYEVRLDVHDISTIYFRNPNTGKLVPIHCTDRTIGKVTKADWKLASQFARQRYLDPKITENRKRGLYLLRQMRMECDTKAKSRKASNAKARKKNNDRTLKLAIGTTEVDRLDKIGKAPVLRKAKVQKVRRPIIVERL